MAGKHEVIVEQVITSFSMERRGRLYKMKQGLAIPWKNYQAGIFIPIWFGPLIQKFKGFSDIFGFEFMTYSVYDLYQYKEVKVPVFCAIEVKTKNDRVRPEQKDFLNYVVQIGGRAYVARESGSPAPDWRTPETVTRGLYHTLHRSAPSTKIGRQSAQLC